MIKNLYFCRGADAQSSNVEVDWGVWIGNEISVVGDMPTPAFSKNIGCDEELGQGRSGYVPSLPMGPIRSLQGQLEQNLRVEQLAIG